MYTECVGRFTPWRADYWVVSYYAAGNGAYAGWWAKMLEPQCPFYSGRRGTKSWGPSGGRDAWTHSTRQLQADREEPHQHPLILGMGPDNETGNEEVVDQWKDDWLEGKSSALCNHIPKRLHVDKYFRPVNITLDQWKNIWKETRDGYNPDDLPRTFHDAIVEKYVEMKGITHIMGMFCLKLPDPLGNVREGKALEEPHQDLQVSGVKSTKKQLDVFQIVIGACFDVEKYSHSSNRAWMARDDARSPFDELSWDALHPCSSQSVEQLQQAERG